MQKIVKILVCILLSIFISLLINHPTFNSAAADQIFNSLTPSQDAWIDSRRPIRNYGISNTLRVRSGNNRNRRALLKFDLSSLPASATIEAAYLDMYLLLSPGVARVYDIHRLSASWLEGNGDGVDNSPAINGVTWYETRYGDNAWTGFGPWDWAGQGGDFLPGVTDSTATPLVDNMWMRWWNLTSDAVFWYQNPGQNFGWLLKDSVENSPVRYTSRFSSRESFNAALRPKLMVSYILAQTTVGSGSINAGEFTTMTVSITNSGGPFGDHIKEATFTVPAGYTHLSTSTADYAITTSAGKNWSLIKPPVGSTGPQTLTLAANSTITDDLANGETLQISFKVMAPWSAGNTLWSSAATGMGDGIKQIPAQPVMVNGTALTLTTGGNQTLAPIFLAGDDQISTGTLGLFDIKDARGNGLGWNVFISATDFYKTGIPVRNISANNFSVPLAPDVVTVDGNAPPSSFSGSLAGAGIKLLSAAVGEGMGEYQVTPKLVLVVPAQTYAGTYTATITETIFSGP